MDVRNKWIRELAFWWVSLPVYSGWQNVLHQGAVFRLS